MSSEIGVVHLRDLVPLLETAGHTVITDPDVGDAMRAVSNRLRAGGVGGVLVGADTATEGRISRPWCTRAASQVPFVMVVDSGDDGPDKTGIRRLNEPVAVNGLLAALGLPPIESEAGTWDVWADGGVAPAGTEIEQAASSVAQNEPAEPGDPAPTVGSEAASSVIDEVVEDDDLDDDFGEVSPGSFFGASDEPIATDAFAAHGETVQSVHTEERRFAPPHGPTPTPPPESHDPWGEVETAVLDPGPQDPKQPAEQPSPALPTPSAVLVQSDATVTPDPWGEQSSVVSPARTGRGGGPQPLPPVASATPDPWGDSTPPPPGTPSSNVEVPSIREPLRAGDPAVAPSEVPLASAPVVVPSWTGDDLAPFVASVGGKGGTGKTSLAAHLAQRASRLGRMRVVLIDGNRGQGDLALYLRVAQANLPTIGDAAVHGDATRALLTPSQLNAARPSQLDRLDFGMVLAPRTRSHANPMITSTAVYESVVAHARSVADLVICDTQIGELYDTSGLIDGLIIPLLAAGGWAVASSDLSVASVDNLYNRAKWFAEHGASPDRVLLAMNRVKDEAAWDQTMMRRTFADVATYVGTVGDNARLASATNLGKLDINNPVLAPILDSLLWRITGLDVFHPEHQEPVKSSRFKLPSWAPFRKGGDR